MRTGTPALRGRRRRLAAAFALLLSASVTLLRPARAEIPRVLWLDGMPFAQVQAQVSPTKTPVFLVFGAPWCGFCRRLDKETLASPIVRDALQPFVGAHYDVETTVGGEMARRFNVAGLPTLLVVSSAGDVLARSSGFMDDQHLVRFLEDARSATLTPEQLAEKALQPGASPEVVVRAAQALLDRGRTDEARGLLENLSSRGEAGSVPVSRALLILASLDLASKGPDPAILTVRRAIADGRDPDLLREAYTFLVTVLKDSGRTMEEGVAWDEFAARLPDDPVVQEDYVRALLESNAPAQKLLDAALRSETLSPDAPGPRGCKAEALLRLGRPADAMAAVSEAIRLGPEDQALRVLRLRIMEAMRPAAASAAKPSGRGR